VDGRFTQARAVETIQEVARPRAYEFSGRARFRGYLAAPRPAFRTTWATATAEPCHTLGHAKIRQKNAPSFSLGTDPGPLQAAPRQQSVLEGRGRGRSGDLASTVVKSGPPMHVSVV
jgi:hypothetical protein